MIYFIRHGQTDWNVQSKVQGLADIPLNENGIMQAKVAHENLKDIKIDKYFCSPLIRTRQTFEIATGREVLSDEIDERLAERDFGEFEGFTRSEFDFKGFWNRNSSQNFERAESLPKFEARIKSFLDDINEKYPDKNILVVSHGGVGIVLKSLIDGFPESGDYLEIEMKNGSIIMMDNLKARN